MYGYSSKENCLSTPKMIEMLVISLNFIGKWKHHIYTEKSAKLFLMMIEYSCLIYEMNKVSSDEERINSYVGNTFNLEID